MWEMRIYTEKESRYHWMVVIVTVLWRRGQATLKMLLCLLVFIVSIWPDWCWAIGKDHMRFQQDCTTGFCTDIVRENLWICILFSENADCGRILLNVSSCTREDESCAMILAEVMLHVTKASRIGFPKRYPRAKSSDVAQPSWGGSRQLSSAGIAEGSTLSAALTWSKLKTSSNYIFGPRRRLSSQNTVYTLQWVPALVMVSGGFDPCDGRSTESSGHKPDWVSSFPLRRTMMCVTWRLNEVSSKHTNSSNEGARMIQRFNLKQFSCHPVDIDLASEMGYEGHVLSKPSLTAISPVYLYFSYQFFLSWPPFFFLKQVVIEGANMNCFLETLLFRVYQSPDNCRNEFSGDSQKPWFHEIM